MNKCEPWKNINNNNEIVGCVTSRYMPDGCCLIVYSIYKDDDGKYIAYCKNNAFGFERVAVCKIGVKVQSHFKSLENLKKRIENGTQWWLCTGYCNCVGEYTQTIEA